MPIKYSGDVKIMYVNYISVELHYITRVFISLKRQGNNKPNNPTAQWSLFLWLGALS